MKAADLPDSTIVVGQAASGREVVYIKNHSSSTAPWRGTGGGYHGDWVIDDALEAGGTVLRVGDGAR